MSYLNLTIHEQLDMHELLDLLELELSCVSIKKNLRKNVSDQKVRSCTFGQVYPKYYHVIHDAAANTMYPKIWELIQYLGRAIAKNINWSSVQLNHNVVCKPHTDKLNKGPSIIVSFGQYSGNDLVIGGKRFNTNRNPVIFDGRQVHSNTDQENGNKYSLVYFLF